MYGKKSYITIQYGLSLRQLRSPLSWVGFASAVWPNLFIYVVFTMNKYFYLFILSWFSLPHPCVLCTRTFHKRASTRRYKWINLFIYLITIYYFIVYLYKYIYNNNHLALWLRLVIVNVVNKNILCNNNNCRPLSIYPCVIFARQIVEILEICVLIFAWRRTWFAVLRWFPNAIIRRYGATVHRPQLLVLRCDLIARENNGLRYETRSKRNSCRLNTTVRRHRE